MELIVAQRKKRKEGKEGGREACCITVPCIWHERSSSGDRPAVDSDCRSSACCAGPLGAVSDELRPSWLATAAMITLPRSGSRPSDA